MLQTLLVVIASSVLPHIVEFQQQRENDSHRHRGDDRDLSGNLFWFILIPKRQRAQDVTQTESHQQDSVHRHFLGVTGDVCPR